MVFHFLGGGPDIGVDAAVACIAEVFEVLAGSGSFCRHFLSVGLGRGQAGPDALLVIRSPVGAPMEEAVDVDVGRGCLSLIVD